MKENFNKAVRVIATGFLILMGVIAVCHSMSPPETSASMLNEQVDHIAINTREAI